MPDCKVQKLAHRFMGATSAVISMFIFSSSSRFILRHFPSINLSLLSASSHWYSPKNRRSSLIFDVIGLLIAFFATSVQATEFDYDGDGLADVAVRRVSNQSWYIKNSGTDNFNSDRLDGIQRTQFGVQETDIPVVADYDGDGIADLAVRRPSNFTWYIRNSSGTSFNSEKADNIQRIVFGRNSEDIPVPADYDGDGIADVAVRRTSNFTWYIRNSGGSNFNSSNEDSIQRVTFGRSAEDIPVKGDFNGDGVDDIAVRRPSTFTWYIRNSNGDNYNSDAQDGIQRVVFGRDTDDIAVPADYDGDGITDIAVRRPSNFTWYILNSSDGEIQRIIFGRDVDDIPVPADYDGDGKADVAVRRGSNQTFYILNSSDNEIQRINFGLQENDLPINAPVPEIIARLNAINIVEEPINSLPVANAGNDLNVEVGTSVSLDGSNSSDADGDAITYLWSLSSVPQGSSAILNDDSSVMPTFIADLAGIYQLGLIVNDGTVDSSADTMTVTAIAGNTVPFANAGVDVQVDVGSSVTLDGSASADVDGDAIVYQWTLSSVPDGSSSTLSNALTAMPSLTPDVVGIYQVDLTVNDGTDNSAQDSVIVTAVQSTVEINADFYTPEPIISRLDNTRDVTWAAVNSHVIDLQRFVFGPASSDDVFVLDDTNNQVAANLSLANSLIAQNSVADGTLLTGMFKFISIESGDGTYRIVSTKHSNYVLDLDDSSDNVILRDYRSGTRNNDTAAYLAFTVTSGSTYTLQATGRWQYDSTSASFVEDNQWQSLNLIVSNNSLQLSAAGASEFTLYSPPIDFDMPFDLNPEQTERVTNSEVTPETKNGDLDNTATQISSTYASQVSAKGNDSDTAAATLSALQEISDTLEAQGSALRYPIEFYSAIREGFLKRIYVSSDSTDGVVGQNTVPYVYFTNESDDEGVHHPFMVVASYNLPDSLTLLWDVPRPPGDGLGASYDEESVTRSIHKELLLMKIPLRDYGEVESLTENSMENDLATDVGETNYDHHNYASTSSTGVAIDGVLIYPSYNNRLHISQSEAELSAHGMHSGRGLGAHYHADAYSANDKGLNLYNTADYEGHSHPPIITVGFDGIAGYGIYKDNQGDGVDVALDAFGGHEHDDYGYHYHSWPEDSVSDAKSISYTAHQLPPLGAWAGRINDIPEFWSGTNPNVTGGRSKWLGNE